MTLFGKLLIAREILKKIQQISWNVNAMERRYPPTEAMTSEELDEMYRFYLALHFDLEEASKTLKKLYQDYKDGKNR